jgi:hypothetical protein
VCKLFDVSTVVFDKSGRQQRVQRFTADLGGRVTEEPFGTLVEKNDPLLVANGDDEPSPKFLREDRTSRAGADQLTARVARNGRLPVVPF